MTKQNALAIIANEIESCDVCKRGSSGKAVTGEGNPDAKIVFVGEAPGKQEALTGKPFIGRSGKLLRNEIEKIGLQENDIFILSPVKYLPDRGTPTKAAILHGMTHTQKQLDIIAPEIIVLMGSSAAFGVLGEKISVTKKHGKVIEKQGKKYIITFHPTAAVRFPKIKTLFIQDFETIRK